MKKTTRYFLSLLFSLFLFLALSPPEIDATQTLDRAMVRKSKKRIALIIGNAAYPDSPLRNPVNDAKAMKRTLENLGFDVDMAVDADKRKMLVKIKQFGKRLRRSEIGFFFYAGHGMGIHNRNYLIPIDASVEIEDDVELEGVDIARILSRMEKAGNKLNVVVLDACRNNPFARSFRSSNKGLVKMDAPAGTLIAYATSPGKVASDGNGKNGLYTSCLLQALKKPNVELKEAFNDAGLLVIKRTGNQQIPWVSSTPLPPFSFGFFAGQGGQSAASQVVVPPAARPQKVLSATYTDPTTGMEFVLVKGGCYQMGDTFGDGRDGEKPVHEVCVDDFYMGKYEVTQGEWKKIMGNNPSFFKKGNNYPVEQVSWNDITKKFLPKLNSKSSKNYRLPTEAEWEYAARSGGKKEKYSGDSNVDALGWHTGNSGNSTHRVGTKRANGLGLYDMSGNVWEWCLDWYGEDYYKNSPKKNPSGAAKGVYRVIRGGGWGNDPGWLRAAYRSRGMADWHSYLLGFRLSLSVY